MGGLKKLIELNRKNMIIVLVSSLSILIIFFIAYQFIKISMPQENLENHKITLSKAAVDKLIKQAADDKYIHDVFDGNPKLTMPKRSLSLQRYHPNEFTDAASKNNNLVDQRCTYKGQLYVAGDIVKTDKTWIKCTPTYLFSNNKPDLLQAGGPAWTAVQ